ncbi:MAG: aspartate/glutamate racemase family protein [Burkholderiales bacterium]|nr:aspartate/glutamate racemase family protein [Burkholderiales bacterium]
MKSSLNPAIAVPPAPPAPPGEPAARKPTLGVLGGMGAMATVDFLRKLVEATPAERDQEHEAGSMGFSHAACGPMVRSSYHADQQAHAAGVVG